MEGYNTWIDRHLRPLSLCIKCMWITVNSRCHSCGSPLSPILCSCISFLGTCVWFGCAKKGLSSSVLLCFLFFLMYCTLCAGSSVTEAFYLPCGKQQGVCVFVCEPCVCDSDANSPRWPFNLFTFERRTLMDFKLPHIVHMHVITQPQQAHL